MSSAGLDRFTFAMLFLCYLFKQAVMEEDWEERSDLPPYQIHDLIRVLWRWWKKRGKLLALEITFNSCPLATRTKWVPSSCLLRRWLVSPLCLPKHSLTTNCPGFTDLKEPWREWRLQPSLTLTGVPSERELCQREDHLWACPSAWHAVTNKYLLTKWINRNITWELVLSK